MMKNAGHQYSDQEFLTFKLVLDFSLSPPHNDEGMFQFQDLLSPQMEFSLHRKNAEIFFDWYATWSTV